MKLNDNIEKMLIRDMFQNETFPECRLAPEFKVVAENIVKMLRGSEEWWAYKKMTQVDNRLMVQYWITYDGMKDLWSPYPDFSKFYMWLIYNSTPAEYIRRARQWLVENGYLIISNAVELRAAQAGEKMRARMKGE